MRIVFIVALVLALFITVLCLLRLEVKLSARKDGSDDQVTIDILIPPLVRRSVSVPVVELVEKRGEFATRFLEKAGTAPRQESVVPFSQLRQTSQQFRALLEQLYRKGSLTTNPADRSTRRLKFAALGTYIFSRLHITVKEFTFDSRIGLGDAAVTGLGIGLAWSLIGLAICTSQRHLHHLQFAQRPQVSITPVFDRWLVQARLRCIVSVRLGEIILEGAKHLIRWRAFTRRDSGGRTTSH